MREKEITIYDIARHLGLDASTVSRGLRGHATVSKKTSLKIIKTAEAMGYRFNSFAANLRRKRTDTIGVIIPRLNSYFMADVLAGIEKMLNESGMNMIISQSLESPEKEERNVKTLFNNRVDGLLVSLTERTEGAASFRPFFEKNIPVLFFDRIPDDKNVSSIELDNFSAGYAITHHLLDQGATRIAHITGNRTCSVYKARFEGYLQALKEQDIPFLPELLITGDLSEDAGVLAARLAIDKKANAVFAANDNCAASCMNELKKMGLSIPGDLLVAGFNNDMISRNVDPPLTTINNPGFRMGEMAARNILDQLENGQGAAISHTALQGELIIRGSSVKVR